MIIREATVSSQASQEMQRLTRIEKAELKPMRRSNSVDSLSPKSRFLNAMNTIPMTPGVPYNTIIGDRGRGDSPNSSDGVVPYWSSHLNGAESEDIVPSGHGAHQNPQAIAEVLRILQTNARQYAGHRDHFRQRGTTDLARGVQATGGPFEFVMGRN